MVEKREGRDINKDGEQEKERKKRGDLKGEQIKKDLKGRYVA